MQQAGLPAAPYGEGYSGLFNPVIAVPGQYATGYAPQANQQAVDPSKPTTIQPYATYAAAPLGAVIAAQPAVAAAAANGSADQSETQDSEASGEGKKKNKKKKIKDEAPSVLAVQPGLPFSGAVIIPGTMGFLPPPPANLAAVKAKAAKSPKPPKKKSDEEEGFALAVNPGAAMMAPSAVANQLVVGPDGMILSGGAGRTQATSGQFICHICNKEFVTKGSLKTHGRVHTGERPYACPMCTKTFTQQANCARHIRLMHRENPEALPLKIADPPKLSVPIIKVPKTKKAKRKAEALAAQQAAAAAAQAAAQQAIGVVDPNGNLYYPPPPPPVFYGQQQALQPPPPPAKNQAAAVVGEVEKKSKKSKSKRSGEDEEDDGGGKRRKSSSGSNKKAKTDAQAGKSGEMMFDGQGMPGYNVLSSNYPHYDWTTTMRSPLMGASSSSQVSGAAGQSMPPAMTLDWNFRSKSPPLYQQQQNATAVSHQDWMMRSKSPMPPGGPNGHMQYAVLGGDMTSMYGGDQMYPQAAMVYDPSSYGVAAVAHHQQLSPNSQRKMMGNDPNMMFPGQSPMQVGFTGFFPGQQHAGYVAYTGGGDGMSGGAHQGAAGQHGDLYGDSFQFAGHFDGMQDHNAMMMGVNPGGVPQEHDQ